MCWVCEVVPYPNQPPQEVLAREQSSRLSLVVMVEPAQPASKGLPGSVSLAWPSEQEPRVDPHGQTHEVLEHEDREVRIGELVPGDTARAEVAHLQGDEASS